MDFHPSYDQIHFIQYLFLFSQGLTLLEIAAHLAGKAAKLMGEALGKVKMALAGKNTSFLLDILEGCFGHENLDTFQSTISTEKAEIKTTIEEATSNLPEKTPVTLSDSGGLATAELVFPLKSIPMVIAGLPEPFFPVHGPKTLSHYHCQFLPCTLQFPPRKLQLVITFNMIILM